MLGHLGEVVVLSVVLKIHRSTETAESILGVQNAGANDNIDPFWF